jgi:hypothetical protein
LRAAAYGLGACLAASFSCSGSPPSGTTSGTCAPGDTEPCSGVDASAPAPEASTGISKLPALDAAFETAAPRRAVSFAGEAAHVPLPVIPYGGGPLLSAAQIVTVTFAGDPMATALEAFGASVGSSAWWDTVRAGYCDASGANCVGDGPAGTSVEIGSAPAPSYTDSTQMGPSTVQDWLSKAIGSALLPPPGSNPTSNTLYVLYFPKSTRITLDGYESCVDTGNGFDGYHWAMAYGQTVVPYAVVVECAPQPTAARSIPIDSLLQSTTLTASHEILEAATDPTQYAGYVLDDSDPNNWGWIATTGGGEVGDLCVDFFGLNQDHAIEGPFTVQRSWSNARAAAGLDPCVPAPAEGIYFNAAPTRSFFALDVGESTTFEVDAFSSGALPDWDVTAFDESLAPAPYLSFSIVGGQDTDAGPIIRVNNGSKIQVTMTLLDDPGSLMQQEADGWLASYGSTAGSEVAAHFWPFSVITRAAAAAAGIDAGGLARRQPGRRKPGVHFRSVRRSP